MYIGGCGICRHHMYIDVFKRRTTCIAWTADKQLWLISNIMLFETAI